MNSEIESYDDEEEDYDYEQANVKIMTLLQWSQELLQKSLGQLQCLEPETAPVDKGSSASNAPGALAGSSCTDQDDDGVDDGVDDGGVSSGGSGVWKSLFKAATKDN